MCTGGLRGSQKISEKVEELQEKVRHSAKLRKTLELEGSPVAVAILSEPPDGLKQWRRKATPCMMIQIVRREGMFYCLGECISCGGNFLGNLGSN